MSDRRIAQDLARELRRIEKEEVVLREAIQERVHPDGRNEIDGFM